MATSETDVQKFDVHYVRLAAFRVKANQLALQLGYSSYRDIPPEGRPAFIDEFWRLWKEKRGLR